MADTPGTLAVADAASQTRLLGVVVDDAGTEYPVHVPRAVGRVFAAGAASVVTNGGQAVIAIAGPVVGGYIENPSQPADSGVDAQEPLIVDPVSATPGSAPGSGNGTASTVNPGERWDLPAPLATGRSVHVNAATSGHKFTVVTWS